MHHAELWIIEQMIDSAAHSAEVGALLDGQPQQVTYEINIPGGL